MPPGPYAIMPSDILYLPILLHSHGSAILSAYPVMGERWPQGCLQRYQSLLTYLTSLVLMYTWNLVQAPLCLTFEYLMILCTTAHETMICALCHLHTLLKDLF